MNTTQNIFFIFVLLLAISCKKNQPQELVGEEKKLIGTWQWLRTDYEYFCDGYIEYDTIYPDSDSYHIEIKEEGMICFFENNLLINEYVASIQYIKIGEGINDSSFEIYLDGIEEQRFVGGVYEDSLRTWDFPYTYNGEINCESYKNLFKKK